VGSVRLSSGLGDGRKEDGGGSDEVDFRSLCLLVRPFCLRVGYRRIVGCPALLVLPLQRCRRLFSLVAVIVASPPGPATFLASTGRRRRSVLFWTLPRHFGLGVGVAAVAVRSTSTGRFRGRSSRRRRSDSAFCPALFSLTLLTALSSTTTVRPLLSINRLRRR
jgi:hypothetical protein